jgi:hypothetical protein
MKTFNLKSTSLLFFLGFLCGFSLLFLFSGNCNGPDPNPGMTVKPKEIITEVEKSEKEQQHKIVELETKNQQLLQELATTKELLNKVKQKTKARESRIIKLTESKGFSAKELLAKNKSLQLPDTPNLICDSLITQVNEYIEDNAVKDSLYELQVTQLDSTIVIQDSIINLNLHLNKELKGSLMQSIAQQEDLYQQNQQLKRKFKKQKFRSKLIAIGVTLFSGIAAEYLIRR